MFYVAKFHPTDLYATIEWENISFSAHVINELYELPNDEEYTGHALINQPRVLQRK